ncbi:spore coat biosynthesis protein F [Candidatus Adlerbacteria bacterium RIFCSPHIGHO2_02_FULL_54_18]|uniref:Spore coat biosynthesis protein F n=2 Tax=Candidatus Adleribacteriota TaxID=1752736 RepID=A0A1F4Y2C5_9BACT|nr:MAG: spore coat biosynthesis protein F [Candidatus Adlerbacteria bacterium RIFCSPLOWO2_01_FULL_54_21b]OGC87998.1 MAG: spore coat biosynthesis protein F [Candidatus Adlerbacteria bacterium RIFCSPHIGHO2_02_FULL_54_18]
MKDGKKIVATIEARMTSTRLPGKVLLPMAGEPNLKRLIDRLRRSKYIDEVVIATTVNVPDDAIVALAEEVGCKVWRGSEDNVLLRVLEAAQSVGADLIVEITGDCPLIDWRHIDRLIALYIEGGYDYMSNILERTFPRGFDVQIFSVKTLAEVNRLTGDPVDQENVSLYIYNHPERYKLGNWAAEGKMRRPELRVTLDTTEDYTLLNAIFEKLLPQNPDFSAEDVVHLLNVEPSLAALNAEVKQKDPYGGYV